MRSTKRQMASKQTSLRRKRQAEPIGAPVTSQVGPASGAESKNAAARVGADLLASWLPRQRREHCGALAVAALGFLAFANSLWNGFAYDDYYIIVDSPVIRHLSDLRVIFTSGYWRDPTIDSLYRPLVIFSYALNYAMAGLNPFSYHLINVLLHAVNCGLVYLLLMVLFRQRGLAIATAATFALHPIHTEAVANVVGRAELLSNAFLFLGWLLYLQSDKAPARARTRWLIASIAAFTAAIFSKEHAVVLLGLLVLTDLSRASKGDLPLHRTLWEKCRLAYAWYLAPLAAYLLARFLVLGVLLRSEVIPLANPLAFADAWTRTLTAIKVLGRYLWILLVPTHLSADYSYNQVPLSRTLFDPGVLATLVCLSVALALAIWGWPRQPSISFGIAVFAITILPVSNLPFPIGTIMAERVLYLPSLGFCLLIGGLVSTLAARPRWSAVAVAAFLLLLLGYGTRTVLRNRDWRSDDTLVAATVRSSPNSAAAHQSLGTRMFLKGKPSEARRAFERSLEIYPNFGGAHAGLAAVFEAEGRLDEALQAYQTAIRVDPGYTIRPHFNLGFLYLRKEMTSEAREEFHRAARRGIYSVSGLNRLAKGLFLVGSLDEARDALQRAVYYTPDSFSLRNNLGVVYFRQQRWDEAQRELEVAFHLKPDLPEVHYHLGMVYEKQGRLLDAQASFETARRLRPQNPTARRSLEAIRLRQGRTAEANREFTLADDQEMLPR